MAEQVCSGCGEKRRVFNMPLGPRIINHQRQSGVEVVKEMREARGVLGLAIGSAAVTIAPIPISDPDGDFMRSVEEQIVNAKDLALVVLDENALTPSELGHKKTAIYDAALALVEASRATGTIVGPVLVEVSIDKPVFEPCPGSGKPAAA